MSLRPEAVAAVAVGGALGAVARWACTQLAADGGGFPATTFAINVAGSLLLALLPALFDVRRRATLALFCGPGLLGGFTTMSTQALQVRTLVADGDTMIAGLYLGGTLAVALGAVLIAGRIRPRRLEEVAA